MGGKINTHVPVCTHKIVVELKILTSLKETNIRAKANANDVSGDAATRGVAIKFKYARGE